MSYHILTTLRSCVIITNIHKEELSEIHPIIAEDNIRNLGQKTKYCYYCAFLGVFLYLIYEHYGFIEILMGGFHDEEF